MKPLPAKGRPDGVAFLLAQLGQFTADRFAERIAAVELTPAQAGILRTIAADPGRSQRALSAQLGLLPSRVVAFVDELEDRGYVERRRNPGDRRLHALHLTSSGEELMHRLSQLAREHETALTAGLDREQRIMLRQLLATIADHQGLTPRVHPGYRTLGEASPDKSDAPADTGRHPQYG